MIGKKLAHYEITSELGMGEVWRARDAKLGREVAIKTFPTISLLTRGDWRGSSAKRGSWRRSTIRTLPPSTGSR